MTESTPSVAFVVTCYNLGAYLEEAVDSVFAQTRHDFELVIVDDGSTDPATRALLDGYTRPRTRVIRTPNRGLPAARNLGVAQTTAPYLCMLDADDRLAPTYLERSVHTLEHDADIAFVSHWARAFGASSWEWQPERCTLDDLLAANTVNGAALVRRAVFNAVGGFDESMREGFEDWDFWLRVVKAGYRGQILRETLFEYRRRHGSMSDGMTDADSERYSRLYWNLIAKHADVFGPRMPALFAACEAELAELHAHVHDLDIEYEEWLEPELRRLRDEVARLSRLTAPGLEHGRRAVDVVRALDAARAEVHALRTSWSWRLTAPLRAVGGWWLGRRGARE